MKRIYLALIIFTLTLTSCAVPRQPRMVYEVAPDFIKAPEETLPVGERLVYDIRWLGMPVGEVFITIGHAQLLDAVTVYPITATVKTNRFLEKIYRVHDEFISYVAVDGLYSMRFEKHQREGGFEADEIITYDHANKKGLYHSETNNTDKEFDIVPYTHDPLSALFFFRQQELTIGESITIQVSSDEKTWDLEMKVHGAETREMRNLGTWTTLIVEPLAHHEGKPLEKGTAWVWFSSGPRRIPLIMKAKVRIAGTITVSLRQITSVDEAL